VYPVFKDNGAFFMLLGEWQDRSLILTYLEDAKRNLDAAEPCVPLWMLARVTLAMWLWLSVRVYVAVCGCVCAAVCVYVCGCVCAAVCVYVCGRAEQVSCKLML